MEPQGLPSRPTKVVKIQSIESWNSYLSEAKNGGQPVVAHFTASWCIPSISMNSFFDELASTYQDSIFVTVDVDEVQEVAKNMGVKAMPTFIMMRQGEVVEKLVGANPDQVGRKVDELVAAAGADAF